MNYNDTEVRSDVIEPPHFNCTEAALDLCDQILSTKSETISCSFSSLNTHFLLSSTEEAFIVKPVWKINWLFIKNRLLLFATGWTNTRGQRVWVSSRFLAMCMCVCISSSSTSLSPPLFLVLIPLLSLVFLNEFSHDHKWQSTCQSRSFKWNLN